MCQHSLPDIDDDEAEAAALAAAVKASLADPRPSVPHELVREWLLKLAAGDLTAEPPQAP